MYALQKLREAKEAKDLAMRQYDDALSECVRLGVSNKAMAHAVGLTDAAIRMYRVRNLGQVKLSSSSVTSTDE